MGLGSEGAHMHYRGAHLHDLDRAAANLLLSTGAIYSCAPRLTVVELGKAR